MSITIFEGDKEVGKFLDISISKPKENNEVDFVSIIVIYLIGDGYLDTNNKSEYN